MLKESDISEVTDMKLSKIAELLNCSYKGEDIEILGVNTLDSATSEQLSFLANPKYIKALAATSAGAIIVKEDFAENVPTAIISTKPYEDFARCIFMFAKKQGFYKDISEQAYIHESAKLGKNCIIYPFVTIGENVVIGDNCTIYSSVYIGENCIIGDDCTIYPNVSIMADSELGDSCCIQPGAVIGAEGFGFVPTPMGIQKIPQIGKAVLKDRVEIGANTCVDRAALDVTLVENGSCLDNLVQIGHNVKIGKNNLIISQVGIAGSTTTGDNVILAAQAGVAGHLHIGSNSTVAPKSGVAKDVPENVTMGGTPLTDQKNYMRTLALMPRFPEIFKRLSKIEKELNINNDE